MPNFKSVVHFLLVDFGGGYLLLVSCDGGKTKSTPCPTDLDWTVRLDWSLTTTPSPTDLDCTVRLDWNLT